MGKPVQTLLSLVALGTVIWLAFDARRFDWTGNRIGDRTWKWILGAFLLWIVVFPLYLFQRRRVPLKV